MRIRWFLYSLLAHLLVLLVSGSLISKKALYSVANDAVGMALVLIPAAEQAEATIQSPAVQDPSPESLVNPIETLPDRAVKPLQKKATKAKASQAEKKVLQQQAPLQASKEATSNVTGQEFSRLEPFREGASGDSTVRAEPDYLRNPAPEYPREARRAREQGVVLIDVLVSAEGVVHELLLKESSGFKSLDQAALRAVRDWKFKPARIAGVPFSTRVDVPVRFVLK